MYELFKGYVLTTNKKCIQAFKGKEADELLTLDQARERDEFAGILNDNTVLIDVDDFDESEKLMKIVEDHQLNCRVYETTRGKHFLFLNDGSISRNATGASLAVGIHADIKLGCRTSYSILRYRNKDRFVLYDIEPDEEYQTIPKYLLPVKTKANFADLAEGDGRNQELFNYILTLQSSGFSKDEVKETINLINQFVLKEPLKDTEIDTILRDEAFQKQIFFKDGKFLHDEFAKFLISEYHIIKIGNVLHAFDNGVYVPSNIESLMIKHIPNLKQNQRKEVSSFMIAYLPENKNVADANYVAFANGVFNIRTQELMPFTSDLVLTNKINWNWNPDAYSKIVDDTLNRISCNDPKIRMLLEEVIGYCFYRRNELRKAFMLKGKRHNGKSTFIDMLAHLLGESNISSLDLSDLSHEFKAAALFGKLANLGDDVEDEFIPSAGIFKKVVSGDRISCNVKYGTPIEFNPYCKLIFSGNSIPRLGRGRDSYAIIDRLIIVPFNADFTVSTEGFNAWIKYDLRSQESMEYLIQIGMKGLLRVLSTNKFTTNDDVEELLDEYTETLNPILTFFEEMGDSMLNESTKKCYRIYDQFCYENALKPISHVEFTKQVKEFYGYESKPQWLNGKTQRIFVKSDEGVEECSN